MQNYLQRVHSWWDQQDCEQICTPICGVICNAKYKMAGQCTACSTTEKEFMSAMQWSEFITNSVPLTTIVHKLCKLDVSLAVGYLCNLAPHSQIVRFEPWWQMQTQGAQHASQPLSRGGLPQNKGHFRRNPSVPETKGASNPNYNRSPMMAENEKVLNSTKNATCGSTSPISKNCGSTKFQIEKLWIHIFKIMCFLKFVDPQFSDLEFCGSTVFWNRTCGSTKSK